MNGTQSQWHAIRPWSPHFILTIREITSVSATFILSSTLSSSVHGDPSLSSLGLVTNGSDDEESLEDIPLVSDALSRGLSVNVNGSAWKRVLMRMDDEGDEAIIVLFGLMPGRQYDVELGVVSGDGEEVVHSRMVTQPQQQGQSASEANHDIETALGPSASPPPTFTPRAITLDEYAAQLRGQLAQLTNEREALAGQLKSTRRESQKADATLRGEIESLKRTAERHAAAETRGRQKLRALQEAVKQATVARQETESLVQDMETAIPAARAHEADITHMHTNVTSEAERAKEEADEALRADRKRTADLQAELGTLNARLERLRSKRDKLSGDTLPDLEENLARLIREVELVERDAGAFEVIDNGPVGFDLGTRALRAAGNSHVPVRPRPAPTTPFSSPPTTSAARVSLVAKSPRAGVALSSRAQPFDPVFRPGHPHVHIAESVKVSQKPTITGPALVLPPHTQTHSYTQSWDVAGVAGGLAPGRGSVHSPAVGVNKRPVSPVRQASLPLRMPSYAQPSANQR